MTPEWKIQNKIIKYLEWLEHLPIKLIKTNKNWIPDLLILLGDNKHLWIEVKTETWHLSKLQEFMIKKLEQKWDKVIVPYWYDDFLEQIKKAL